MAFGAPPANALNISLFRNGPEALAVLSGVLQLHSADSIRARITAVLASGVERLCVNVGGLREIDSTGLGTLVGLHSTARKHKVLFQLLDPTPNQMKLFEMTRLDKILELVLGSEAERVMQALNRPEYLMIPPNLSPDQ